MLSSMTSKISIGTVKQFFGTKIRRGSLGLALAKSTQIVVSLLVISIAVRYLGSEKYGIWMASAAVANVMTSFSDGGSSNALVNHSAKVDANSDKTQIAKIIANGIFAISALVVIAASAVWVIVSVVDWSAVLSLEPNMEDTASGAILIVASVALINILTNVVPKVRHGMQQIGAVSLWESAGHIAALPVILWVVREDAGFFFFIAAYLLVPILVRVLGVLIFLWNNPSLKPKLSYFDLSLIKSLFRVGAAFFVISITGAVGTQADSILIANLASLAEVSQYSVYHRIFFIPWIAVGFLSTAIWPQLARLYLAQNEDAARSLALRFLGAAALFAALSTAILFLCSEPLLRVWVGSSIQADETLNIAMALYGVCQVLCGGISMIFMASERLQAIIFLNLSMLTLNITTSIVLIPRLGASGAVLGTVVGMTFCFLIPALILLLAKRTDGAIGSRIE